MVSKHADLVADYQQREARWNSLLDSYFPQAQNVRWGLEHRVYRHGDRAVKIQHVSVEMDEHAVEYEYEVLCRLDRFSAWHLNPKYHTIDGEWEVLELDWINGECLADLIDSGRLKNSSIVRFLWSVLRMSWAGVIHKQLRVRHIYRRNDGSFVLIDFGGASITGRLSAIATNFKPVFFRKGRPIPRSITILLKEWLWSRFGLGRHRTVQQNSADGTMKKARRRWLTNARLREARLADMRSAQPPMAEEDISELLLAEELATDASKDEPQLVLDYCTIELSCYVARGERCWGLLWEYLLQATSFHGKRILDVFGSMGLVNAYARAEGAGSVTQLETCPAAAAAALPFARGMGLEPPACVYPEGFAELPASFDIGLALSVRFDSTNKAHWRLLSRCSEIFYLSHRSEVDERQRALDDGFVCLDKILDNFHGPSLYHAKRQ